MGGFLYLAVLCTYTVIEELNLQAPYEEVWLNFLVHNYITAYHSQAQSMIERVNRTLKTTLKCAEIPTEWHNYLPWAFLVLRNLPKEDVEHFLSNDLVFGEKLRPPGDFFVSHEEDESMSLHAFVNSLTKRVAFFRYNYLPRKANRSSYFDTGLFDPQVTHVFVRNEVRRHSLQSAHKGPYLIVNRNPKYFTCKLHFTTHQGHISIDRLKPAIFSMESLNEAAEAPFPHFSGSGKDHRPICSCLPAHTNKSLNDDICQNNSEYKYTSRGRRIHTPTRFKDYELA